MAHAPSWLVDLSVGIVSGLTVHLVVASTKFAFKVIEQTITLLRKRQKLETDTISGLYVDLEEILGDFLEKYRELAKKAPVISRWGFFLQVVFDSFGLMKAIILLCLYRLFGVLITPRA